MGRASVYGVQCGSSPRRTPWQRLYRRYNILSPTRYSMCDDRPSDGLAVVELKCGPRPELGEEAWVCLSAQLPDRLLWVVQRYSLSAAASREGGSLFSASDMRLLTPWQIIRDPAMNPGRPLLRAVSGVTTEGDREVREWTACPHCTLGEHGGLKSLMERAYVIIPR